MNRAQWESCENAYTLMRCIGDAHVRGTITRRRLVMVAIRCVEPVAYLLSNGALTALADLTAWSHGADDVDVDDVRRRLWEEREVAAAAADAAAASAAWAADDDAAYAAARAAYAADAAAAHAYAVAAIAAAAYAALAAAAYAALAAVVAYTAALCDVIRDCTTFEEIRWIPDED
jgi:hypothetical protein